MSIIATVTKLFAISIIPRAVEETWEYLSDYFSSDPVRNCKTADRTRMTVDQYDIVREMHKEWVLYNHNNPTKTRSQLVLVQMINDELGLDKCRTTYANIWRGRADRNSFITIEVIKK